MNNNRRKSLFLKTGFCVVRRSKVSWVSILPARVEHVWPFSIPGLCANVGDMCEQWGSSQMMVTGGFLSGCWGAFKYTETVSHQNGEQLRKDTWCTVKYRPPLVRPVSNLLVNHRSDTYSFVLSSKYAGLLVVMSVYVWVTVSWARMCVWLNKENWTPRKKKLTSGILIDYVIQNLGVQTSCQYIRLHPSVL